MSIIGGSLHHSSQLNLSTPGSQCQFNMFGMLCGQCQHGLSTVSGLSQCSNIYLLIIIPIGIAGFVVVLLLFILNMTVTSGDINSFLMYIGMRTLCQNNFWNNRW